MPSVWAARGRSRALWSPGGGKLKVCHLRVSQVGVRQGCLQRCLACPRCGRVGIIQAGQIPVQVLVLVAGSPCPTPQAAVGWGRRWGDLWRGILAGYLSALLPVAHPRSPTAPRSRGEGRWGGGGGQGAEHPPAPAWAGLGAAGSSARRSWYGNVLASRSCRGRRCRMLFTPPGTFSHLFCAHPEAATRIHRCPRLPSAVSFRGPCLGCLSPPPHLQQSTCSMAGAKKCRSWWFGLRWPNLGPIPKPL